MLATGHRLPSLAGTTGTNKINVSAYSCGPAFKPNKASQKRIQTEYIPHFKSRRESTSCCASSSSAEDGQLEHKNRAVLHDFCMIIPYSLLVILGSLLSIPLGAGWQGLGVAGLGGVELLITIQSLKRWQKQTSHLQFTSASAGLAGFLTYRFWLTAKQGLAAWLHYFLAAVSAIATAFLVYNILAGGNPVKEVKESSESSGLES